MPDLTQQQVDKIQMDAIMGKGLPQPKGEWHPSSDNYHYDVLWGDDRVVARTCYVAGVGAFAIVGRHVLPDIYDTTRHAQIAAERDLIYEGLWKPEGVE